MTRTNCSRRLSFGVILGFALLGGCSKNSNDISDENLVLSGDRKTDRTIGDQSTQFQVLGKEALQEGLISRKFLATNSVDGLNLLREHLSTSKFQLPSEPTPTETDETAADNSLILGFPLGLLGESQVFGGVVTKVSDGSQEKLGQLKLADLSPIHARAIIGKDASGSILFGITGCARDCSEGSAEPVLLAIPTLGVDAAGERVLIDLAELGKELNLIEMQDPNGSFTQLKTKSNKAISFDYSYSTLVFDVETRMVPLQAPDPNTSAPETVFVVRWYLKLSSVFNPAFTTRPAVPEVGFFMTERSATPHIQRHAIPANEGGVRYFIKNVPTEHRKAFAESFDGWNEKFQAIIGKKLITYEFLETTDPRYALVTAGDIRFNVIEWDLDNVAPYGGFGPSIANQHTGELLSSNVLVQGPKIIDGYKKWFEVAERAETLRREGRFTEAETLLRDLSVSFATSHQQATARKFALKLGRLLTFSIKSQEPGYDDSELQRPDFDQLPKGFTFETYMHGYFIDLVEHELGHNLGLRHNFTGNLGAKPTLAKGGVSHSVMEYLGRGFRHLDHIGEYDEMALKYGYRGILPNRPGLYCTDENVAAPNSPENSAECSRDDATHDPFAFFESRLDRQMQLLARPDSTEAPAWEVPDMDREVTVAVTGMALYVSSAAKTSSRWTRFFTGGDRPASADGVKDYVLNRIKARICDPSLAETIAKKDTAEAKAKTEKNIAEIRTRIASLLVPMRVYSADQLACD